MPVMFKRDPRVQWVREKVRGERILDIGCAAKGGYVHQTICASNPTSLVVGLDNNRKFVKGLASTGYTLLADGFSLPFINGFFDAVFMGELIEHVWDPKKLLGEAYRVLKQNGRLYLTTPNLFALQRYLRYFFKGRLEGAYPLGSPTHRILYDPFSLSSLLKHMGFTVVTLETRKVVIALPRIRLGSFDLRFPPFSRVGSNICVVAVKSSKAEDDERDPS